MLAMSNCPRSELNTKIALENVDVYKVDRRPQTENLRYRGAETVLLMPRKNHSNK